MKHTNHPPFMTKLIRKIARKLGARVLVEPEFEYVGRVVFRNGKSTFFRNRVLSINTMGSVEIARDKAYASFFLHRLGYRVPVQQTFFSDAWCKNLQMRRGIDSACAYAHRLGFPVIIKPNNMSQGAFVTKVRNARELANVARKILQHSHIFLVQKYIPGRDYRIVVLDRDIISAYERSPLTVTGTGKHTIRRLLERKQRIFVREGRDTRIDADDFRIKWKLRTQGLSLRSVLPSGKTVTLLDNANLSTGGDSEEKTVSIHDDYKQLAVSIARDMGLRLCGVDLITSDITRPLDQKYVVLEINAAPGLDHYAAKGKKQQKIVEELYGKVLRAMEQGR